MKESLSQNELIFNHQALMFMKTAELKSFSRAARFFGVTQGAVSRSITDWENHWGFPLFDRTKRPVVLTAEGQVIQNKLREFARNLNGLTLSLKENNYLKPVIRVGCVESMSKDLLPALSLKILPKVSKLTTIIATSNLLVRLLKEGKLDVIICSDPGSDTTDLAITNIFQEGSIVVLPRGMEDIGNKRSWKSLALCGIPFLKYHHASGGGKLNETFLHSLGITFVSKLEADSNTTILALVAMGAGWSITRPSTLLQAGEAHKESISVFPMPKPLLKRKVYIVSNVSESVTWRRHFLEMACEILKNSYLDKLLKISPWLESEIKVLDLESGELKTKSQFDLQD